MKTLVRFRWWWLMIRPIPEKMSEKAGIKPVWPLTLTNTRRYFSLSGESATSFSTFFSLSHRSHTTTWPLLQPPASRFSLYGQNCSAWTLRGVFSISYINKSKILMLIQKQQMTQYITLQCKDYEMDWWIEITLVYPPIFIHVRKCKLSLCLSSIPWMHIRRMAVKLHIVLTSAVNVGERSATYSGCYTPRENFLVPTE